MIADSLIGNWGNPDKDADSSEVLHILKFNAHEYLILFFEEEEISIFRAFSKSIGESEFLTLTEIQAGIEQEVNYIFARYQVQKNQLKISLVEEKLLTFLPVVLTGVNQMHPTMELVKPDSTHLANLWQKN